MGNPYADMLGLGGQSLSDFLQTSDTPALRQKYYSGIEGALTDATQQPKPDQGNLLWSGLIPTLAAAALTGGKSLAFSGAPLTDALATENKRAGDMQKLSVEAKLKGAGLLGDELTKRESLAATAAERAIAASQRADSLAETARHDKEVEGFQKEHGNEMVSLQRDVLGQRVKDEKEREVERQASLDESKKQHETSKDAKEIDQADREDKTLQDRLKSEYEASKLPDMKRGLENLREILDNPKAGQSERIAAAEAVTRMITGASRGNTTLVKGILPDDVTSRVQGIINDITSGSSSTLSAAKADDLRNLETALRGSYGRMVHELVKGLGDSAYAPVLQRRGELDSRLKAIGASYGDTAANSIDPSKTYVTPNGKTISGKDALSMWGSNPGNLSLLKEAQ